MMLFNDLKTKGDDWLTLVMWEVDYIEIGR